MYAIKWSDGGSESESGMHTNIKNASGLKWLRTETARNDATIMAKKHDKSGKENFEQQQQH